MRIPLKLLLVDDESLHARNRARLLQRATGWEVVVLTQFTAAIDELRANWTQFSAVIVDVAMPAPPHLIEECHGGYQTGVILAQEIRKFAPNLPILGLSAEDTCKDYFQGQRRMDFLTKDTASTDVLERTLRALIQNRPRIANPKIFIVHGHDEATKVELKEFLQKRLKLPTPLILNEQPELGRTIIEKLEDCAKEIDLALVLLTPDDSVSYAGGDKASLRARQNVIFELGFFLGHFGRAKRRVILLYRKPCELPSDLLGIVCIDISNGIKAAAERIRAEVVACLK
jgi:predicted nucleotide-binding protein